MCGPDPRTHTSPLPTAPPHSAPPPADPDPDPAYLAWLDALDQQARLERELDELNLQQQHAAQQAEDDDNL
jgi:hypothetical protein